ncbi:MAG: N-acetylmuramoyl-L-alanine amidase [Vicinamibacterales bacterium]|nr:N-acetylmuramoyl-L-alanine amidase [Vicinamibacterales bacterium]
MKIRRPSSAVYLLGPLLLASAVSGQAPTTGASLTILSREGRRPLPVVDVQGHQMAGLDDLSNLFQLTIREDSAANAVTVSYKTRTVVLTPDQSLASMSGGRLISLPAPLTRQGRRWLVPVEFISRALAPMYDTRVEFRPASRLVVVGDVRVPRITAQYEDSGGTLRITFEITPKAAPVITQDQNRLLLRVEADALDALFPPPPSQNGVMTAIRAVEPNTIVIELGPRFASYRTSTPVSSGAAAAIAIDLVTTAAPVAAAPVASVPEPPAVPATPLPVFGAPRPSIRTIVIDAGHGGDDPGVKGASGLTEKDVTLAVARRLRSTIENRLGIRVLMTRDDDARIDADARVSMANNNKADLFVSLHANGSPRPSARGAAIFSLGLDKVEEDARRQSQANREVLPVYGGGSREFSLVEWELAQASHIEESTAFAALVEQRLKDTAGLAAVSIVTAPMRSLAGANMPAISFEMGYLSNPEDEKLLRSAEFQNGIALAVTDAIVALRDRLDHGQAVPAAQ